MGSLKRLSFVLSLCLAASISVWGQSSTPGAQYVYVATGGPQIYAVSTGSTTTATALIPSTHSADAFDSLAVGPDNTSDNAGGNYFFLYACDSTNGSIVRLQLSSDSPDAAASAVDTVYDGGNLTKPVCGRVDSVGDLYVTSATPGSGVWVLEGASSTPGVLDATQVFGSSAGSSFTGGGITQKNVGDMMVVDTGDNKILTAAFGSSSFASSLSDYITSGLDSPVGIARAEVPEVGNPDQIIGDLFVVNQGKSDNVVKYDPTDKANPSTCASFSPGGVAPTSIAASTDNLLYVGLNASSQNKWAIQVLDGSSCESTKLISLSDAGLPAGPLAVAVPPASAQAALQTPDTSTGGSPITYNFGSSLLQITPGGCTLASVTQMPMSISYLNALADAAADPQPLSGESMGTWNGGTAVAGNGEGGFGTVYSVAAVPSGCNLANVQTNLLIDAFYDTTTGSSTAVTNPRVIHCTDDFSSCEVVDASGNWPTGGYLPQDQTVGGKIPAFGSQYFLVNGYPAGGTAAAVFCGLESPMIDAMTPESPLSVFSSNQGVSVKFKLGQGSMASCPNGPYVTDAVVLLSIAQVTDGLNNNAPVFERKVIETAGNSTSNPPVFKFNSSSHNYQFSLNLDGYTPGIYAMTLTFLTNNSPAVTRYFEVQ